MRKGVLIAGLGVVALGCAAFVAVPAYIQHRAIEEAASRGVVLTIDRTRIGTDGVHLEGVAATTVQIPNAKISANEVNATWDASSVVVIGAEVTIDGPITPPNVSAADKPTSVSSAGPSSIHVQSAHISWTHVAGDTSLDLANVNGDFSLVPRLGDAFTCSSDVSASYAQQKIGPFPSQFSRDTNGDHLRVAFDPTNPNAETLVVDRAPSTGLARYEWTSDARPLSKIGIPLDLLGVNVAGDPTVQIHFLDSLTRPTAGTPSANGTLAITTGPMTIPGLPAPAAGAVAFSWSGNPDESMPVSAGKFSVGPFTGPITGTIVRPVGAISVSLEAVSNSVPCSTFSSGDPLKNLLGSSAFGAMAALAGAQSNVTGDVKLSGSVQFDSRNPGSRHVSFAPVSTCGVSISLGTGGK